MTTELDSNKLPCTYCCQKKAIAEIEIERSRGTSFARVCEDCTNKPLTDPLGLQRERHTVQ